MDFIWEIKLGRMYQLVPLYTESGFKLLGHSFFGKRAELCCSRYSHQYVSTCYKTRRDRAYSKRKQVKGQVNVTTLAVYVTGNH